MLGEDIRQRRRPTWERSARESRVEAERVLLATEKALLTDGDLDAEQRPPLDALDSRPRAREGKVTPPASCELEASIAPQRAFASRRMDAASAALAGHKIELLTDAGQN